MLRKLYNDEAGFVASLELVLILTLVLCAAAVGWSAVRVALVQEINDLAKAIGNIDQTYAVPGLQKLVATGCLTTCAGFQYTDGPDSGDDNPVEIICDVTTSAESP